MALNQSQKESVLQSSIFNSQSQSRSPLSVFLVCHFERLVRRLVRRSLDVDGSFSTGGSARPGATDSYRCMVSLIQVWAREKSCSIWCAQAIRFLPAVEMTSFLERPTEICRRGGVHPRPFCHFDRPVRRSPLGRRWKGEIFFCYPFTVFGCS